jgi:fructokinase
MQRDAVLLFGEVLFDVFPDQKLPGGAPLNVARHLRAFGLNPVLITRAGSDADRSELVRLLRDFGLDTRGVQIDPTHPTGRVLVQPGTLGREFSVPPDQAYDFINVHLARLTALSAAPRLLYFGTLAQRRPQSRRALHSLLKQVHAPRFLDLNLCAPWFDAATLRSSLQAANLVKVSEAELAEVARVLGPDREDPDEMARRLVQEFAIDRLIVTCGAAGAWLLERGGAHYRLELASGRAGVADAIGGGDAFAAVCILSALRDWPLETTLERADAFARAVCRIRGAIAREEDFYRPWRQAWGIQEEAVS